MTEEILTKEWIEAKKKEFGKIFKINIGGDIYVYRYIKTAEVDVINEKYKDMFIAEANGETVSIEKNKAYEGEILKQSIVYPENLNIDDIPAQARIVLMSKIQEAGMIIEESKEL